MTHDFLTVLAAKRQKYLDGVDANEGDINLDIFEDFYPDKAHFVFEILQNAEDAEASEVIFELSHEGCLVEHDGKRLFDAADVRSITGIHNSTKKNRPDQIGKWGIGFKSVFVYTVTPEVHSGPYAFKIIRLIKPEPVKSSQSGPKITRFWLPFNHPEKRPDDAFNEVAAGLRELSETVLLFLSSVQSISWKITASTHGEVLRIEHTNEHIEVLKQENGSVASSSHFLRFIRPAEGLEKQNLGIAFNLEPLPNVRTFDSRISLHKQARVVPTVGQVAVFFPAKRETSGLKFHVHIPGIPTPDRASIKDTPENDTFFEQLATLSVEALSSIKELGFLTREFLEVLPNARDELGNTEDDKRFDQIRNSIVKAFDEQPLTPTFTKTHAPAKHLYQAKDALKRLVSDEDIEVLIDGRGVAPRWAANTDKEGTRIHRFMSGLALLEWRLDDFVERLVDLASEGTRCVSHAPYVVQGPDSEFMAWLSAKPVEWHQQLYALLFSELAPEGELYQLNDCQIVRLFDGSYSVGSKSFFPDDGDQGDSALPCVAVETYSTGRNKTQQHKSRKFLEEIGVRVVGEAEQVELILQQRYTYESEIPDNKTYRKDFRRFVALLEKEPTTANLFKGHFVFKSENTKCGTPDQWRTPNEFYLDTPYMQSGLSAYYKALDDKAKKFALDEALYKNVGVSLKRIAAFAKVVGAISELQVSTCRCYQNPEWSYLSQVGGERHTSPIDQDYEIQGLADLLKTPTLALSMLVWQTMAALPKDGRHLVATYRRNASAGSRQAASSLVHVLRAAAWVPQGEDSFLRPAEASRELLPAGFPFDLGQRWLKSVKWGEEIVKRSEQQRGKETSARELGFSDLLSLERARRFAALPLEDQVRFLTDLERETGLELPDHSPPNPYRRAAGVGEMAAEAPERSTEKRSRSVSVGRDEVKAEAAQYLQQQYSVEGEVICQVCKKQMPFKLDDGTSYFEKIEFLPELSRRHHQNYLGLCPNHAAMFKHANGSKDFMLAMFSEVRDNELEVVLAQKDATVYFTKTHIADLKKIIEVEANRGLIFDDDDTGT